MPFPTDEARDEVAFFHSGVFEDPVVRQSAGPIRAAGNWAGAVGADELVGVGWFVFDGAHGIKFAGAAGWAENADAFEGAIFFAASVGMEKDFAANSIAGEECDVETGLDGGLEVAEHLDGPVFVVTDGEESFGAVK